MSLSPIFHLNTYPNDDVPISPILFYYVLLQELLSKFYSDELINDDNEICILRNQHAEYLTNGLVGLSAGFISLDASRPWLCYWILQALYLLDREPIFLYPRIVSTLVNMQDKVCGGFGGGPGQISHCAPTYAAVLALCTVGTDEALGCIDRARMYNFFLQMKHSSGGFRMHRDGEIDTRCTYTVLAVSSILNIMTDELIEGVADYILQCQTYEGGFGGEPGNEAHGGYNFCALAGLLLLGRRRGGTSQELGQGQGLGHEYLGELEVERCDLDAQEGWLLRRQGRLEGGFQGRTNKLVDSCYSFWQVGQAGRGT